MPKSLGELQVETTSQKTLPGSKEELPGSEKPPAEPSAKPEDKGKDPETPKESGITIRETPGVTVKMGTDEVVPPEEKPKEEQPSEKKEDEVPAKFRFKNQEESEVAEAEAKRKMHEATTESAGLKRQVAEMSTKRTTEDDQEFISEVTQEAAKSMRALSDEDPDIRDKELKIMGEMNMKIAQRIAERQTPQIMDEQRQQQEAHTSAVSRVKELLANEELKTDQHFNLFVTIQARVMADRVDYNQLPEEEQFGLVMSEMRPLIGHTEERFKEIQEANDKIKKDMAAVGRGANAPKVTPEVKGKPMTLGAQMTQAKSSPDRQFRGK